MSDLWHDVFYVQIVRALEVHLGSQTDRKNGQFQLKTDAKTSLRHLSKCMVT